MSASATPVRVALADDQASETWTITGAVLETREIAVLTSDVERGDAIKDKDLTVVRRPASQIERDAITSMADLVGMVPRRALRTSYPCTTPGPLCRQCT